MTAKRRGLPAVRIVAFCAESVRLRRGVVIGIFGSADAMSDVPLARTTLKSGQAVVAASRIPLLSPQAPLPAADTSALCPIVDHANLSADDSRSPQPWR